MPGIYGQQPPEFKGGVWGQGPAFQAHIDKSEYVTRRMHTIVGVALFPGFPHEGIKKEMQSWAGHGNEAIVGVII